MRIYGAVKGKTAQALKARTQTLLESGFAGIHPELGLVDRREHPDAEPIAESATLGAPAPKKVQM